MKGESLLLFVAGALLGGAAAMMWAPRSGRDTREKIKEFIEKEFDEMACHCNDRHNESVKE